MTSTAKLDEGTVSLQYFFSVAFYLKGRINSQEPLCVVPARVAQFASLSAAERDFNSRRALTLLGDWSCTRSQWTLMHSRTGSRWVRWHCLYLARERTYFSETAMIFPAVSNLDPDRVDRVSAINAARKINGLDVINEFRSILRTKISTISLSLPSREIWRQIIIELSQTRITEKR